MTENIFMLSVINMSIAASYVIIAVFVIRLLISKLPKKYSYVLWLAVGLRLVLPFSFSSVLSIFNLIGKGMNVYGGRMEFVPMDIEYATSPSISTGIRPVDSVVNSALPNATPQSSINPIQIYLFIIFLIWAAGFLAITCRAVYTHIKTKKLVGQAVRFRDNIYECDNIPTPFVMGIIRPKIYIPFRLGEKEKDCIIAHERHHIGRFDNAIKPAAYALAAVHWFNPLVWLAYRSMIRDMEMSCDEWVLLNMGYEIKADYGALLLSFAHNRRYGGLSPLAFGENAASARIKNILGFKKPRLSATLFGAAAVALAVLLCISNGKNISDEADVKRWAQAFSDRDTDVVADMSSRECMENLKSDGLLLGEDEYSLGWSSPWPWGTEQYKIAELDEKNGSAEILYYAVVSDPHIWVWRQSISFSGKGESFSVSSEKTEFYNDISSGEEFFSAYPNGEIKDTFMDYGSNGFGEVFLLENADESRQSELKERYSFFYDDPAEAAAYILNISNDENINVYAEKQDDPDECTVIVDFGSDETGHSDCIGIKTEKLFGDDGIWIPRNAFAIK